MDLEIVQTKIRDERSSMSDPASDRCLPIPGGQEEDEPPAASIAPTPPITGAGEYDERDGEDPMQNNHTADDAMQKRRPSSHEIPDDTTTAAVLIQSRWRGSAQRTKYLHARSGAATRIQAAVRSTRQRRRYRRQREKAIEIQSFVRGRQAIAHIIGEEKENKGEEEGMADGGRVAVEKIIRILNAVSSAPVFPLESPRNKCGAESPRPVVVPDARAGERGTWSPEELRGIQYEVCDSLAPLATTAPPPRRSGRRRRRGRKKKEDEKKRKETPEEKMGKLSVECVHLLTKLESLPKFSPEWVLSKLEIKLIVEEVEYWYAESMAKRAPMQQRQRAEG